MSTASSQKSAPTREVARDRNLNKHQRRTEITRSKLLQAASKVFARDGFEASKIDDIATEAGYSRGAFYANFQSKEDLFFDLLETQSTFHIKQISELLAGLSSDEERLRTIGDYYARGVADRRQWSMLILEFKLYALRHPELRSKLVESHRQIRAKIKWKAFDRLFPKQFKSPCDRSLKRIMFEAFLHGIVLEQAYDSENLGEKQASKLLRCFFDLVIQAPEI